MSRPSVLASPFHHYGPPHTHYDSAVHSALAYRQPLPLRPPELPAAYNTQHTGHHGRTSTVRMSGPAYMPSDEELAHLQKLSNDFEPELTGPLVGERQDSAAIATEYQHADPIYRIKTAALPSKYAYFRTCRGDGHCGWRAIAFGYFEALIRVGDAHQCDGEIGRLDSMGNLLDLAGYSRDVYIDFAEEAFDLLRKLAVSLRDMDGAAPSILLQTFNDMSTSMAIITYFKLLASAWVQSRSDEYRDFVAPMDLKTYCAINIEAANCEIDNVAVVALADAIIKPVRFGLEILYLDRSQGEEVNPNFVSVPVDEMGMPIPNPAAMLRLLYRPGHYDILYKQEDFIAQPPPPPPPQAPVQVALQYDQRSFVPMDIPEYMTMIPGLITPSLDQRWSSASFDFSASPAPQPQMAPVQPYAPAPTPTTSHQEYVSPIQPSHVSHHNPVSHHSVQMEPPVSLPMHPPPPAPPMAIDKAPSVGIERGGPFRPSIYEFEPGYGAGQPHSLPFQTSIFRNSHYNTAHFLNPDFQPEEWSPETEYATGNRARHKSASQ